MTETEKELHRRGEEVCPWCGGSGFTFPMPVSDPETCEICQGKGVIPMPGPDDEALIRRAS